VLLIDGLNQLTDGLDLRWLPERLGPGVRIVVSCVDDPGAKQDGPERQVLTALESRRQAPLRVPVGELGGEDVRAIIIEYLHEYCKELDQEHVDAICAMPQARNPLYLLVMLGELRTLGGNDMNRIVGERIASMTQDHPDTVSLFQWVLRRLEVFGAEAVKLWCTYLALGRVGMASRELSGLLARKLGADAAATALRIERGLRRYLQRRGLQWDFFHTQLREAVTRRCLPEASLRIEAHKAIAGYFEEQIGSPETGLQGSAVRQQLYSPSFMTRITSELPFHYRGAGDLEGLRKTLCRLDLLDWALDESRKYDWINHWRFLEGYADPEACYAPPLDRMKREEGESARLATMMSKVATLLCDMGRPSPAFDFAERALAISKRVNGNSHPATADHVGQLARAAIDLGRYHQAKSYYEQLIDIDAMMPMTYAERKAAHLSAYGVVLQRLDQYDQAL